MGINVLTNINNIRITPNEYMSKYTLWRNLRKLLQNDKELNELFNGITSNLSISGYSTGIKYKYGDVIWYLMEDKESIILLRSLIDNNDTPPERGGYPFEDNGWEILSKDIDINTMDVQNRIAQIVSKKFQEHVKSKHVYGQLNDDNIQDKLLKKDLSNRNRSREQFFYPYETGFFKTDNTIINGMYRKYDNGLVECDIVFRLGYAGEQEVNGVSMTILSCNQLTLSNDDENRKYIMDDDSSNIFNNVNSSPNNYSTVGTRTMIMNRNDYVNVYSATIKFPFIFTDTKYMIFVGDVLSEADVQDTVVIENANHMTFCNKTHNSVTALLVTYPLGNFEGHQGLNTQNGGLVANSFRCKVIGRIKSS